MKENILRAAMELFASKGIDRVSVREIVAHVRVSKPVLYYYFKDKDDLCRQLFMFAADELKRVAGETLGGTGPLEKRLAEFFSHHLEFFRQKPMASQFALRMLSAPGGKGFEKIVEDIRGTYTKMISRACIEAEKRGELRRGRAADAVHASRAVIAHIMLNAGPRAREFDRGMPARMARMIIKGCKTA